MPSLASVGVVLVVGVVVVVGVELNVGVVLIVGVVLVVGEVVAGVVLQAPDRTPYQLSSTLMSKRVPSSS